MAKKKQVNEEELVRQADATVASAVVERAGKINGRPLPADFDNPEIGTIGHCCLDPQGNYRKDWSQLKIHKQGESMPSRQYFARVARGDIKEWKVKVGAWVDVPPELVEVLSHTEVQVISLDIENANPILDASVKKVVDTVPRFSFSLLPSS